MEAYANPLWMLRMCKDCCCSGNKNNNANDESAFLISKTKSEACFLLTPVDLALLPVAAFPSKIAIGRSNTDANTNTNTNTNKKKKDAGSTAIAFLLSDIKAAAFCK